MGREREENVRVRSFSPPLPPFPERGRAGGILYRRGEGLKRRSYRPDGNGNLFCQFSNHSYTENRLTQNGDITHRPVPDAPSLPMRSYRTETKENTTLSGGSLGSRVDEERSQLRELM